MGYTRNGYLIKLLIVPFQVFAVTAKNLLITRSRWKLPATLAQPQ